MPREAAGAGFIYALTPFAINIPGGTGQASSVLSLPKGFRCSVVRASAVTKVAATGAGATRTLNIRKGSATGTVVATVTYALADGATVGGVKDIPVTAANADFLDTDTLTIEWASGGTAFTAGELIIVLETRQRLQQRN